MARITKEDAQRLMNDVPEEFVFRCSDGRTFRNIQELKDGLETMGDEAFASHVSADKNDFGNWVRDIIKDGKLARDLVKSSSRTRTAKAIGERLIFLESKLV